MITENISIPGSIYNNPGENKVKIIIVEDDEIIRESFVSLINESGRFLCTEAYEDCETALKYFKREDPDIVLMDIELPGISGIEGIKKIKKLKPETDIIVITVHSEDDKVYDALCAGANGYLIKNISPQKLIDSLEELYRGGAPMSTEIARKVIESFHRNSVSPLSPRETEVLQLLAKGKSYTMIANDLFIDKETVRTHIKNIYLKLNVNSKAGAIERASKDKLI
ncbi:MAG TPA: response regulator transcription factor [Ignavibacteriaceae bacterium]|nr:response regulator transcription factor [Ignavibacteriaceae bacterium]